MRKRPQSTADVQGALEGLIKGAEANKADMKNFGLDGSDLQKRLENFIKQNSTQEKLKADLQQATRDLNSLRKEITGEYSRGVFVLEWQYGKNKEKTQEFGIVPRMLRPHKGPRKKEG